MADPRDGGCLLGCFDAATGCISVVGTVLFALVWWLAVQCSFNPPRSEPPPTPTPVFQTT